MKLALLGLANTGKTTIFNALTGLDTETTVFPSALPEPHIGVAKVPDVRVDRLAGIYDPKKITHAQIEYVDYMGLTRGDTAQNRKVFDHVRDADAVVHVVRAFEDPSVVHPGGGNDPLRDTETVELELILGDLDLVEKRLERIDQSVKKGKKPDERERAVLRKCRDFLESETPLRAAEFSDDDQSVMRHLQFLSSKPVLVLVNVGEEGMGDGKQKSVMDGIDAFFSGKERGGKVQHAVFSVCGKIEMEIAQLSEADAQSFLEDLGIAEPALHKVIRHSYGLLGLISFLTVGSDEVRAWTVTRGATAIKAAGKIHSDIERGFIRAEVVAYDDFIAAGDMAAAREKGQVRLEGKTYEVRDGDIINFRFHV